MLYKHYGNKYLLDEESGIFYQNKEDLQHFLKVVTTYKYYNILSKYLNIFLDNDYNNSHTSFFDCECMSIHLLHSHLERFTIIHELTHCVQYLCNLMEEEDLKNTIFDTCEPIIIPITQEMYNKYNSDKFMLRESYNCVLDIINSFGRGCYAMQINTCTHIPSYYKDNMANYILEAHSNYTALKHNHCTKAIHDIPQEILSIIKLYDKEIMKRLRELD